jgi:hypothetical protein
MSDQVSRKIVYFLRLITCAFSQFIYASMRTKGFVFHVLHFLNMSTVFSETSSMFMGMKTFFISVFLISLL